jgi:phosphatidylinositol-bisphosphatase
MGMMGNKGAVGCRFKLMDSWVCVVNSHLAADSKDVDRRNQDYAEICRRLSFTAPESDDFSLTDGSLKIWDCDQLIWLGDLNYRITLGEQEMKRLLVQTNFDYLQLIARFDQLARERVEGRAFSEFVEGPVHFPPTYKYDPGTSIYDTSEKRRTPSWCDRVLWRRGDPLKLVDYRSQMSLVLSDHKPVSARLTANVKRVQPDRRSRVRAEVMRELDKLGRCVTGRQNPYLSKWKMSAECQQKFNSSRNWTNRPFVPSGFGFRPPWPC